MPNRIILDNNFSKCNTQNIKFLNEMQQLTLEDKTKVKDSNVNKLKKSQQKIFVQMSKVVLTLATIKTNMFICQLSAYYNYLING